MEIKAARYFEGFQAKSQKEQLEFVNDSRKQIEELVGEVKIALTQQGEALPEQIRTLIEHQIEELSSEQLFDRLSGLKGLLSSIAFLGVDSKSISEFVDRNQPYIAEYLERLMNVEVSVITKTLEGRQEIEDKVRSGELSLTQGMLETPMFKPFLEYDRFLVDCINKIAKNEKKGFFSEDFSFRDDEVQDPGKWLVRVKQSKNAAVWLLTYEMLISFIRDIHDKRVEEAKIAYANRDIPDT